MNIDSLLIICYNDVYYIKLIDHEKKLYSKCRLMGDPWVPGNSMGLGLGKNSKRVMGMGFLMGSNIFHGFGFGVAKLDGFILVAIPNRDGLGLKSGLYLKFYLIPFLTLPLHLLT